MIKKKGNDTGGDRKQILKQLRMNGLVNSDLEVIHHLDREIQKESDVIPVAVKTVMYRKQNPVWQEKHVSRLFADLWENG